jgi:hypothetical protein
MVENKLEQQIIQLYDTNLVNLFSINQISKLLKKKYPYINKKVSELIDREIIKKIVVGRSYLCSLNLENPKTLILLALNEMEKKKPTNTWEIIRYVELNKLSLTILTIIESNKKLFFVVDDIRDRRPIQRQFTDVDVIDKQGLLDMLSDNKELFTNHTIIYGYENFFNLMRIELNELKRQHSPLKY